MITKKAVLLENKKKLDENMIGDAKSLAELTELSGKLGLEKVAEVEKFIKDNAKANESGLETLRRCVAEKKKTESVEQPKEILTEDKGYISEKDAADDFTRINHYLSVSGYSEIPYTLYDEVAVAAADDEDAENAKLRKNKLGYIGTTGDGMVTVTAATPDNLVKARDLAADFDCPIESETVATDRYTGQKTYSIVINPYCGYEYGTPECAAAMDKYTSEGQKNAYQKKDDEESTAADADEEFDDDFEEAVDTLLRTKPAAAGKCEECGKDCEEGELVEEVDLGYICKECVAKHKRLGESLTFVRKIK